MVPSMDQSINPSIGVVRQCFARRASPEDCGEGERGGEGAEAGPQLLESRALQQTRNSSSTPTPTADVDDDETCFECLEGGFLVVCSGCQRQTHLACAGLWWAPEGDFFCRMCTGTAKVDHGWRQLNVDETTPGIFECGLCAEDGLPPLAEAALTGCVCKKGADDKRVCTACAFNHLSRESTCPFCKENVTSIVQLATEMSMPCQFVRHDPNALAFETAEHDAYQDSLTVALLQSAASAPPTSAPPPQPPPPSPPSSPPAVDAPAPVETPRDHHYFVVALWPGQAQHVSGGAFHSLGTLDETEAQLWRALREAPWPQRVVRGALWSARGARRGAARRAALALRAGAALGLPPPAVTREGGRPARCCAIGGRAAAQRGRSPF